MVISKKVHPNYFTFTNLTIWSPLYTVGSVLDSFTYITYINNKDILVLILQVKKQRLS